MDSLKNEDLAKILGMYQPWFVSSVEISGDLESLTIVIGKQSEKGRFSFLTPNKKNQQVTRRWQHVRFGHYTTYIQATMSLDELVEATDSNCPAFLGMEGKNFTRELEDTIRIAYSRNLSPDVISGLLGVKASLIEAEIREIETEESQRKTVSLLPLESNPVWRGILLDEVKLSTRLLPLKLLLSRLKLDLSRSPNDKELSQRSVADLRNFFIRHALQLKSEYEQVGATSNQSNQGATSNKTKLVLPGTKNTIWHEILTGNLDLNTTSMALKLNLAQQKRSYTTAATKAEQLEVVRTLQMFFKHNARQHIPELKLLTAMLAEQKTDVDSLPPANHDIWKQLLIDDQILNSEKINYRLFLSKVKLTYLRNQDEESIQQLRNFFSKNAKAMTEEIEKINTLAKAI
jgi:hypothetical protein